MATLKLNNVPVITESAGVATVASALVQEGTGINSTGETGTSKFLRIDGDGTSSWQTVPPAFEPDGAQVFNESGADVDFRIESDDNANMFFVDASTDRVGIGTNAPDMYESLTIVHARNVALSGSNISTNICGGLHIDNTLDSDTTGSVIKLSSNSDGCVSAIGHIQIDENDSNLAFYTDNAGTLTEAMRIDNSQHVLPATDNLTDLGSSSKRWRNIYTSDLHLANERGNWTVIEEEDYLTLRNNKTNKVYKLVMEEIE